jgi:putative addiction module killer protein
LITEPAYQLEHYQKESGDVPFAKWLDNLRDRTAIARIRIRLARVRLGNFGTVKPVGDSISELKIDHGPGYRIYYAICGKTVVLLLVGGDKSTQRKDIETAKLYWQDYNARCDHE